jgi:hypothetical protein
LSAAVVKSAVTVESTSTMAAAAMTAAVTTPMGSHVRWDETQRQEREEGAEGFGSSCHDSLRFKLPDAARN